jgi:type II secretory ATPase GspE/PulE/Tfp pilus assembly ATPase PilB-like protein
MIRSQIPLRPHSGTTADSYFKEHPAAAWILDAKASDDPILPMEEMHPDRMAVGRVPDVVRDKFKCACYEADDDGWHIMLPHGTPLGAFRTELSARLDTHIPLSVGFGDPEALQKFIDHDISQPFNEERVSIEEEDDATDRVLDCGDELLLRQRVGELESARDVLRWSIAGAIEMGATDIHLDVIDGNTAAVRFRHNGVLHLRGTLSPATMARVISIVKIRMRGDSTQRRQPQDGKFAVRYKGRDAEVRVSTLPVQPPGGEQAEGVALRILGRVKIPNIRATGIGEYQQQQLQWVTKRSSGVFLITGPTGSGKTTTLNCVMQAIADDRTCVLSVEAPVEIPIKWVKQTQVDEAIGFTFAAAGRAFLRHDPDVIMIGEIRDAETAKAAGQASQTGHLVFSTLHCNFALFAVPRLLDLGLDRSTIASTLCGLSAQRLMRCLCPNCREEIAIPEQTRKYVQKFQARLVRSMGSPENHDCRDAQDLHAAITNWLNADRTFRAGSCQTCKQTGYDRQRAVMEIYLLADDAAAIDMIMEGRPLQDLQKHFAQKGLLDLPGHYMRALISHDTTYDELEGVLPLL